MEGQNSGIFTKNRLEAFTDGVFAIIVTLLVLEIRVPHIDDHGSVAALWTALLGILPKFVSWVISFFTVCVIWVNHHRLFKVFSSMGHGIFWWNATLLLLVSFIPFPTALMGDYPDNHLAVAFYGVVMALMGFAFTFLRLNALRTPGTLAAHVDREAFRRGTRFVVLFGPLPYLVGVALAWAYPAISFVLYGAVAVYFIFPHATQD
jgi:uncharacterized membrane protein